MKDDEVNEKGFVETQKQRTNQSSSEPNHVKPKKGNKTWRFKGDK